jgi:hypothetical protein
MQEPRVKLTAALRAVQQEYPEAKLTEVRLEWRVGERHDHGPSKVWDEYRYTVQVGNDRGSGSSVEEAGLNLREERSRRAQVPSYAERIAAILREVPDEGFMRHNVLEAVQGLLTKGRG